ncbi:MAG TPA: acyl-CoA dehydrogenase family protein [Thermodesulfovibrionia bacterium]|nr:acyl-CoA dehydrogenase family protein [Thermodesulfovibrionia bacterium]
MDMELTQKQKEAKGEFKAFVDEHLMPNAEKYDQEERLPQEELIDKLAQKGYLGAIVPKAYGGSEMDMLTFGLLCEEIGRASLSVISLLTVHGMVCQALIKWGTEEQRSLWLPRLASGEAVAAFGLTEPDIGSDAKNVQTRAVHSGNSYILTGRKKWISCGQIAKVFLIFASLEDRPAAFLVERGTEGFSTTPIRGMLGFRAAMLAELEMNDCPVPEGNIVGRAGFGFSHVAGSALDHGRYCVGWACVGLAQGCLDACIQYTNARMQFGVLLRKHQLIQQMIAEMITNIKAARALCYHAAYLKDTGSPDMIMEASIAKYFCSQVAVRAASDAVQIHGANGCSSEYPLQRYLRDAKITEIIEGSSQIQQLIISQYGYQEFLYKRKRTRE